MIFQRSMGPRKSRYDVPNGNTQGHDYLLIFAKHCEKKIMEWKMYYVKYSWMKHLNWNKANGRKKFQLTNPRKCCPIKWKKNNRIAIGKNYESKEKMGRPQYKCIMLVFFMWVIIIKK